jgi:hypothetical protein
MQEVGAVQIPAAKTDFHGENFQSKMRASEEPANANAIAKMGLAKA